MAHRVVVAARKREQTISPRERKSGLPNWAASCSISTGPSTSRSTSSRWVMTTRGYWWPSSKTPPPAAAGCLRRWREHANLLTRHTRWEEPV